MDIKRVEAQQTKIRRATKAIQKRVTGYLFQTLPRFEHDSLALQIAIANGSLPDTPDRKMFIGYLQRIALTRRLTRVEMVEAVRGAIACHQKQFDTQLSAEDLAVLDSAQKILDEEYAKIEREAENTNAAGEIAAEAARRAERNIKPRQRSLTVLEEPTQLRKLRKAMSK